LPFIDTPCLVLYRLSDAFSLFLLWFFVDQTGGNLTKTTCRNLNYAHGGSCNWTVLHWYKTEGNLFCSQSWCLLGLLHPRVYWPFLSISSRTDWWPTVLLTLRTLAMWNWNQRISIILPILYVLLWGSSFAILTLFLNSVICKRSNPHLWLSSWFILW
jgi:hypothetical protein